MQKKEVGMGLQNIKTRIGAIGARITSETTSMGTTNIVTIEV